MNEAIISVENLYKHYPPDVKAVDGISFEIRPRQIFSMLGPNGAGKTTTVEILEGLRNPTSGVASIFGVDVTHDYSQIRDKVGILPQNFEPFDELKPPEAIEYWAGLYDRKMSRKDIQQLLEKVDLTSRKNSVSKKLSGGEKRKLGIALSVINEPEVLFLDEPTVGLDPDISIRIREEVLSIHQQRGITVLLTTHNMREAEYLCGRIAFLKEGKILTTGTAEALKRMVRIGDLVKIEFKGTISEDELLRSDGVINYAISGGLCEILVDDGEKRLGPLVAMLSQDGAQIKKVTVGQTDLEDVFIEFAKGGNEEENR
jgi:ABC-2 type transport system ATP-binding protein